MISFYDKPAIDDFGKRLGIDPQAIRRARIDFFKRSRGSEAALQAIPEDRRADFAAAASFHPLTNLRRFDSEIDGASKLVSSTPAGFSIETVVLRPSTGRTALCVSSQVGCAAACAFCATGHMGVARDLTAAEILDQIVIANELLALEGRRVRNLVFMGMGEPMHNEATLVEVLATLQDPAMFAHPPTRTLVSTVGVPDSLLRVARRFPDTNFAISLHSATQSVRETIIPLARRYSLEQLRETILQLNRVQPPRTCLMIEYLMLEGLNDSQQDASTLIDWLAGLRVHVNLIPFNRIAQAPQLRSSPRTAIEAFGKAVRAAGYPATIRYSLGHDIDAACGQLVQTENRAVARRLAQTGTTPSGR